VTEHAPSLRVRLTISIVSIVGLALLLCSLAVDAAFVRTARLQFDTRLAQDAHAVSLLVEENDGARWEIEAGAAKAFEERDLSAVEVRRDDGALLARHPYVPPALPALGRGAGPTFSEIALPGQRRGRLYRAWLLPRLAEDMAPEKRSGRRVQISVARDLAPLSGTLRSFRLLLWAPTLGVLAVAALATYLAIRTMLRHVAKLSERVAALDANALGRVPVAGVPAELRPPFLKLNELLARIECSLARERQFNADVSHELRTPLAGLRSILEVSGSRDRSPADYRCALAEALTVVRQMEVVVENLLMLARLGAGAATARRDDVALKDLVEACFAPHAETARVRRLRFENRIPAGLAVASDGEKLRLVLSNLLSNAAEYTAAGGWIAVESDPAHHVVLAVRNSGPPIPAGAEAKLFDPFFRLDVSRAGTGEHFGIGLAIVRGVCEALGCVVIARNEPGGIVAFEVSNPALHGAAPAAVTAVVGS
jgi:signal transduction histidine kinase